MQFFVVIHFGIGSNLRGTFLTFEQFFHVHSAGGTKLPCSHCKEGGEFTQYALMLGRVYPVCFADGKSSPRAGKGLPCNFIQEGLVYLEHYRDETS